MVESTTSLHKQSTALPVNFFTACASRDLLAVARVYAIVRCFDGDGRGWIYLPRLRRLLSRYKSPATASRWIDLLTSHPAFARVVTRDGDGGRLHLASPRAVLESFGEFASRTFVHPELRGLIEQSWRREVHLSVLATRNGLPTSHEASAKRSGISASAQCRYETKDRVEAREKHRKPEITVHRNCRAFRPGDPFAPRIGVRGVRARSDGVIIEPLPNTYEVPRKVTRRRRSAPGPLAGVARTKRRYFTETSKRLGQRWMIDRDDIAGDTVVLIHSHRHKGWTYWT